MALAIPPGFGNAAFTFTSSTGTQPFVTTLGVDLSEYAGTFVAAANEAMAVYATSLASVTDNDLTLEKVTLAIGQDGPGGSVDSNSTPVQMSSSGTFGPVAVGVLARKVTNEIGRRGRGRMFLPGTNLESGTETDGSLTSSYRTTMQNALDDLYEGWQTTFLTDPVLFHSTAPTDPTPITGLSVGDLVGIQRGRIR